LVAGRTLGAYRADPNVAAWTEAALNWNNQPAALVPAATAVMPATDQYVSWTVTSQVKDLYTLGNNGFVVRDQDETGTGAWQQFNSRAVATNKPQLYVAWS
ncbi:DNRLRE domain-containing protein, partial [Streptomyces sp. A1136]